MLVAVVKPPGSPSKGLHLQQVALFPSYISFPIHLGTRYFVFYPQQEGVCPLHEVYSHHSFLWVLHQLLAVILPIPKTALTAAAVPV